MSTMRRGRTRPRTTCPRRARRSSARSPRHPDDPSLRLGAAWLALEDGAPDRAVVHVHAGLARETDALRRAQLLLWGARAAAPSDAALAKRWTDELGRMTGDEIAELQAASRRRFRGRPHVNLMMADAY